MEILIVIGVILLLIILITTVCYVKVPPDTIYVVTGFGEPRFLKGIAGIRIPFLERIDKLSQKIFTANVTTTDYLLSNDQKYAKVDATVQFRFKTDEKDNAIKLASKFFLNESESMIVSRVYNILESAMYKTVRDLKRENLESDYEERYKDNANSALDKMGLEVFSCNLRCVMDHEGEAEKIKKSELRKIDNEIEVINRKIELTTRQVELEKIEYEATNKTIEAEIQSKANAELYRQQKIAEAEMVKCLMEAEAVKAMADADAVRIEKKTQAINAHQEAAVVEMLMTALPEIVRIGIENLGRQEGNSFDEDKCIKVISDIIRNIMTDAGLNLQGFLKNNVEQNTGASQQIPQT